MQEGLSQSGEAMQPEDAARTIYFIEPQLGHLSGGSMYNAEMVKRLQREALGTRFLHPLQSPVTELLQHCQCLARAVCPGPRRTLFDDPCVQSLPASTFCPMPNGRISCSTILSR